MNGNSAMAKMHNSKIVNLYLFLAENMDENTSVHGIRKKMAFKEEKICKRDAY